MSDESRHLRNEADRSLAGHRPPARGDRPWCHVAPGAKLKLVPLARRYEVSRGPLREAASRLAAEGLVTIEDQRGFRVSADLPGRPPRRHPPPVSASRSSPFGTPCEHGDLGWEGQVMAACHVLARVTDHDGSAGRSGTAFLEHHLAFHEALVSACPSDLPAATSVSPALQPCPSATGTSPATTAIVRTGHRPGRRRRAPGHRRRRRGARR